MGSAAESTYGTSIFSYPKLATATQEYVNSLSDVARNLLFGEFFEKSAYAFDGFINQTAMTLTPDLKGMQWRCLSDFSLQTNPKGRISSSKLHRRIQAHLARGIPLALQINVYNNWREQILTDPTNPLIPLQPTGTAGAETLLGSHFFTVAGYDRDNYIVINSMGTNVGNQGVFCLPKQYVTYEQDCGPGTGTFALVSTCWTQYLSLSRCIPTGYGCETNQTTLFDWRRWVS
jgi:hypothetical protein